MMTMTNHNQARGRRWLALGALAGLSLVPHPASAQDVKVELSISRELASDIRRVIREVVDSRVVAEIRDAARRIGPEVVAALDQARAAARQSRNWRAEQTDRETRTVDVGGNQTLDIRNVSGDITVTVGRGSRVTLEISRRARAADEARARAALTREPVRVTDRGQRVLVEAPTGGDDASIVTTFAVTAPAGTNIALNSISGEITVTGIQGAVSAETVSGDVTVSGVPKLSLARTISGDIVVRDADGDGRLEVGTVSGDVTLERVKARHLEANTVSGELRAVDVRTTTAEVTTLSGSVAYTADLEAGGRYQFHSHSGELVLTLGRATGFQFEAETFSGRVTLAPDFGGSGQATGRNRRSLRATVGNGSATLEVTTFSGNVVVNRR